MANNVKKLNGIFSYVIEDDIHKRSLSDLNGTSKLFDKLPWFAMSKEEKRKYLTKHNPELSIEEIEEILKYN